MTNLTKWAVTLTIKRFIKKIDTEFALLALSCFKSFLFMSRYYCQSHCWNNSQTPSMLFFWAGCANFLPENAKTLLFCILLWKLAYFMGEYVSLKGGIAHLYWCFMLCCRKFWNIAFVEFFRMYFLYVLFSSPFSDFGPSGKRKKHCQRQSGPRVVFSLRKLHG